MTSNKRKYLLVILFLCFNCIVYCQSNKNIQIKNLMKTTHTLDLTQNVIDYLIEDYKKKNLNIPLEKWVAIKKSISYFSYLKEIENIYFTNYSEEELNSLIIVAKEVYPARPPYKQKVQKELYDAGKKFGKYVAILIKNSIK
jgi:hypothetical protein